MPIEGELVVRLTTDGSRVNAVQSRVSRPSIAPRLLPGRPAAEAPALLESLFAICGRSQGIAATSALEAARGVRASPDSVRHRERRIAAETLQEFAWRFLIDQPRALGRAPHVEIMAECRRLLAPLLEADGADASTVAIEAWSRRILFGIEPRAFLAFATVDELLAWTRDSGAIVAGECGAWFSDEPGLGASAVELLPPGDDAWIATELRAALESDATFEAAPVRRGRPCETGALARMERRPLVAAAIARWGRGVAARLAARLVETASLVAFLSRPVTPRHGATAIGANASLAWVETARGLLVHRVALDGDRVADWRIVAPTEWNFHPEGAFAQGALGLEAGSDEALRGKAMRLAASLDPCVAMRCEVGHA